MITRRQIVLALGASALAASHASRAQKPSKIPRIGFLSLAASKVVPTSEAFRQGLRELGYVEGENLAIEWRYADNHFERLHELAMELVRLNVDVIVTGGTPSIAAAQKATATIPIVMTSSGDPVASGFVKSLARPGTNITGLSIISFGTAPKQLELLTAMVPKLSRVGYLINPVNEVSGLVIKRVEAAAQGIGISVLAAEARSVQGFEPAFTGLKKRRAEALIIANDSLFITNRDRVASLAAKYRLPSISGFQEYVTAGGLMSYGANRAETWRHAAIYVDKILKGAKPSDLPVEQPTRIELDINAKTAKKLGLAIPQSIQVRADRVIE